MKKRNLNWLLALLAALALVFAGACSDGSDEAGTTEAPSDDSTSGTEQGGGGNGNGNGGNNNTSGDGNSENNENNNNENNDNNDDGDNVSVSDSLADKIKGTKWTYASGAEVSTTRDAITLVSVTLSFDDSEATVTGEAAWAVGDGNNGSVAHAGTITATSYKAEGDTINVTLGTGEGAVKLPLKLDSTSYSVSDEVVTIRLDSSSYLEVASGFGSASFEVSCDASTGCGDTTGCNDDAAKVDIFSSGTNGGIAENKQFKYQEGA